MMRALVVSAVLLDCVKPQQGSRPASSAPAAYGSSSSAPAAYGASSGTQVYRTTATGNSVSGPSREQDTGGGKQPGRNDLLRAGLITLGVSYVSTVVIGQTLKELTFGDFIYAIGGDQTVDKLWIPVFGAWDALIYNETEVRPRCEMLADSPEWPGTHCDLTTPSSLAVGFGAVAQTVGLVLTIRGLLRVPKPKTTQHDGRRVMVTPYGNAGGAGLVVTGGF